jgi:hypothetical protein
MMEAASTSETLVNFYQTIRRNILEDSHLQLSLCTSSQIKPLYVCVYGFRGVSASKVKYSYLLFKLTLSRPGKFYLDMLETPGKFLVMCSASFKKSPKTDFFIQLFEKITLMN